MRSSLKENLYVDIVLFSVWWILESNDPMYHVASNGVEIQQSGTQAGRNGSLGFSWKHDNSIHFMPASKTRRSMINSALVKPYSRLILAIVFITLTALAN